MHAGHLKVVNYVKEHFGLKILFEITKLNCDKGEVLKSEIERRFEQFKNTENKCISTMFPNFIDKYSLVSPTVSIHKLYPSKDLRHNVIIGSDTLARLLTPKYYDYDVDKIRSVVDTFNAVCRFLVFPRIIGEEIKIPKLLNTNSVVIINDFIPVEISSTKIRSEL